MAKKVATTVYITEQQDQALKYLAKRQGIAVAEIVREGVDLVLEREQGTVPVQLPLFGGE